MVLGESFLLEAGAVFLVAGVELAGVELALVAGVGRGDWVSWEVLLEVAGLLSAPPRGG